MGLLDRIAARKNESDSDLLPTEAESVFATKAVRKFLACLTSRQLPVLVDLGPVIGSNISFFGTLAQPVRDMRYTKFIVADDGNLRYRTYRALRSRQPAIPNRDIIRMFEGLRVSDSFLQKNNLQEILFRKPA